MTVRRARWEGVDVKQGEAIQRLIAAALAAGGRLAQLATAARPAPRAPRPEQRGVPQLALWVHDADDLPARPWRVHPELRFDCRALDCRGIRASECVRRQLKTEAQRTKQRSRGQGSEFPLCDTRKCAQGRGIREALDPSANVTWTGAGAGWLGRFDRPLPPEAEAKQEAARARLERVGLLEPVRTLDIDPDPEPLEARR